jgi:hypothetical protein
MDRRGDELTSSAQQAAPGRSAEPYTGPSTAAQFAALDVLREIAAMQERAWQQDVEAGRPPQAGYLADDELAMYGADGERTALLTQTGVEDAGEPESAPSARPARRSRVLALGRKTLAFLVIPGARRSPE